jgi:osmoprotectant transport system ATP-binding protein
VRLKGWGVARALAADPPILLMDEPFGAVDPLNRERLQTQFQYIQKELRKTVIFVTHDLDEAIRLADNIAVMKSGQLVQYDTPEKILSSPANKFVHDFVGSDRALKKLSRLSIEPYIRETKSIIISATVEEASRIAGSAVSVWLLNEKGQLIGWADMDHLKDSAAISEAAVLPDIREIAIPRDTTMRQALSLMLGQGVKSLPVIDQNGGLLGEISLSEIEEATVDKSTSL